MEIKNSILKLKSAKKLRKKISKKSSNSQRGLFGVGVDNSSPHYHATSDGIMGLLLTPPLWVEIFQKTSVLQKREISNASTQKTKQDGENS